MAINKTTLYSTGLGESVSDGKGGLLVNGSVIYVDALADLQALPTSDLVDGQAAIVDSVEYRWDTAKLKWWPANLPASAVQEYQPGGAVAYAAMDIITDELDGDSAKAFPSAVRYQNRDYIFYRSGVAHTGTDGKIIVSVVDHLSGKTIDKNIVHNETGVDARDPCVLRDNFGNAVLVGGVMKVAVFKPNDGVYIYDWNASLITNQLVNGVKVSVTNAIALRSDFRLMDDGVTYAFVGYGSGSSKCYWVTTTDFVTFNEELIGDGNEAGWCQTSDGYINVIARNDVGTKYPHAIVYKRLATSGAWEIHSHIRRTLNAPTLTKMVTYRGDDTQSHGWVLLARDKTGRVGLSGDGAGRSSLVAMWSKDDHGRSLNDFDRYQVLAASPLDTPKGAASGDAHYATAVASKHGTEITIYTYAYHNDDYWAQASSFGTKIWKIDAWFKPGDGILTRPYRIGKPNLIRNGDWRETGKHWETTSSSLLITTPADANKQVLRVDGYIQGGGPSVFTEIKTLPGKVYRLCAKIRRVSGAGADNRHVYFIAQSNSQDLRTLYHEADPAIDSGVWHVLRSAPFIATNDDALVVIRSINTAAVSEVSEVYVAEVDDYAGFVEHQEEGEPVVRYSKAIDAFATSGTDTRWKTFTYSNAFWNFFFGIYLDSSNKPLSTNSPEDVTVEVLNANQNGKKVLVTGIVINADWSITGRVEIPPESTDSLDNAAISGFLRVTLT